MSRATPLKKRLTRQDWIEAAFELFIEAGVAAVSVDRLAGTLGITRGSFYHHFSDREDLLRGLLDFWAERWTFQIREQIENLGLDPATTLLALMRTIRTTGAADYDAAIRAWALHDSMAREVVSKVDQGRLAFIKGQFEALGFKDVDAENRARLLLHYEMAAPAMFASISEEECERLLVERHKFLTTAKID